MLIKKLYGALAFLPSLVHSLGLTDSIQDADPAQSGYLGGAHGMDPNLLPGFGVLWKNTYNAKETWYAKPLVYTPLATGKQILFTASTFNIIRTLDPATGAVINSRQLQNPFSATDAACGDMPNFIGVAGTPIIDPATDIAYLFSKGYKNNQVGPAGVGNGTYKFYAINVNDLSDVPGFPVTIDGHYADNDPTRYFIGGVVMQRPSLTSMNGVVLGGFGGHCDQFNYTGMVVAVSKTSGVGVTSIYAMEASPGAPSPQPLALATQNGGKAAIWQAGMGLVNDAANNRVFFVTGNGQGHQNGLVPASGRMPLSTLDECVVNMHVSSSGKLSVVDYFEPHEYINLDAGDRDLSSAGMALLDPSVFKGAGVNRIAIAGGKTGIVYVMNADNLGGYKQGPGGADGVLQMIQASTGSFFNGPGSYPGEGGYIYYCAVGAPIVAYKFSVDANGKPQFTFAGQTLNYTSTGRAGVGPPTITTLNGQPGSAIVWVTDVGLGLKAFHAVPNSAGNLVPITLPSVPGLNKFGRPVFGNGMIFVADSAASGSIYGLGYSPSQLTCTHPINFGSVPLGATSSPQTVTCTAKVALSSVTGCYATDPSFVCQNSSLPTGPIALGASFSFPVTWTLPNSVTSYPPGSFGGALNLYATTGTGSVSYAIPLSGTVVVPTALLNVIPIHVGLGGIVLGTSSTGLVSNFTIFNQGNSPLSFTGFAWDDMNGDQILHNITWNGNAATFSPSFTSSAFPAVGASIPAGGSLLVPVKFLTTTTGSQAVMITIWSNGGSATVSLSGSGGSAGVGLISTSVNGSAYSSAQPPTMNLGTVLAQNQAIGSIQICNSGGSQMTILSSNPPADTELLAISPSTELYAGLTIPSGGGCVKGGVEILAAFENPNRAPHTVSDVWTISADGTNPDGTAFGTKNVSISTTIVGPQLGLCMSDGTARYQYLGCYYDGNGRQMAAQLSYTAIQQANNENGQCQLDCFARGYTFAATEYSVQCWCGNTPPAASKLTANDKMCAMPCQGDSTQACGGYGTDASIFYDVTKYNPTGGPISTLTQAGICPLTQARLNSLNPSSSSSVISSTTISASSSSSSLITSSSKSSSQVLSSSSSALSSSSSSSKSSTLSSSSTVVSSSSSSSTVAVSSTLSKSSSVSSSLVFLSSSLSSSSSSPSSSLSPSPSSSSSSSSSSLWSSPSSSLSSSSAAKSSSVSSVIVLTSSYSSSAQSSSSVGSTIVLTSSLSSSTSAAVSSSASSVIALTSSPSSSAIPSSSTGATIVITSSLAASSSRVPLSSSSSSDVLSSSSSSPWVSSETGGAGIAAISSSTSVIISLTDTLTLSSDSATSTSSVLDSSSFSSSDLASSSTLSSTSDLPTTTSSSSSSDIASSSTLSSSSDLPFSSSSSRSDVIPLSTLVSSSDLPLFSSSSSISSTISSSGSTPSSTFSSSSVLSSSDASTSTSTSSVSSTSTVPLYSPTSSIVGNYTPLGCFAEPAVGKILPIEFADDAMSLEECNSYCGGKYQYWGLEFGRECWCGNSIALATSAPSSDCSMQCQGDGYELCGGPNRINLYNSTIPVPIPPIPYAPATVGTYHSLGCYTEAANQLRALTGAVFYDYMGMTVEACATNCAGYTYWGTEYGGECYCGNSLGVGAIPASSGDCSITCPGNNHELCGGGSRLNLYSNQPIVSSSSVKTSSSTKATSSIKTSTVAVLPSTSSSVKLTSTTSSLKLTSTTSSLKLTSSTKPLTTSTSKLTSPSTSFRTSTSTSLLRSTASPTLPWASVGCFSDAKGKLKKLAAVATMNSAICQSYAAAALTAKKPTTYHYIALENGKTCLGATTQPTPIMTSLVGAKACTVPCSLTPGQTCGGKKMYNLWANVSPTITGAAITATA